MGNNIHLAEKIIGNPLVKPTLKEKEMRLIARRSLVASKDIKSGEKFDTQNIDAKRPGDGLSPDMMNNIIGLRASRDITKGEKFL